MRNLQPLFLKREVSYCMSETVRSNLTTDQSTGDTSSAGSAAERIEIKSFTAQFANLDNVREFVGDAAQKCGLNASAIYAAQLAVDEAFSNIIEHAYGGECMEMIECTCQIMRFWSCDHIAGLRQTLRPNQGSRPRPGS